MSLTLALALASVLSVASLAAQVATPPRDVRPGIPQPVPVGTASIGGMVVMAGSGQPARRVRVTLSGSELRGSRSSTTDDQGRFSFTALPAGRYNLTASRPGHLTVSYGQRQPGRGGVMIQLSDGQKFQATLQIPKGSVITGTVLDEHGEASPQVQVRAMRVVLQNGRRTLQGGNTGATDDRGIYRLFGLMPGEYVVCATPRNTSTTDFDRMQAELGRLRQSLEETARISAEAARVMSERITSVQGALAQSSEENPAAGYAPVCYPGSISTANAAAVPLGVGEEKIGIDFQLQLAPLARIEGMVINSTGAQLREITVLLTDAGMGTQPTQNMSARADAEGRFRIPNVPPGQYRLSARGSIPPAGGAGRGGGPGPRQEQVNVWASTDIFVDGRNVPNVVLTLQPGVSLSGQIAFDGTTTAPTDLTRLRVTLTPVEPSPFGGSVSGRVEANGRFIISSVTPGVFRLTASAPGGWSVESSTIGGHDALDVPFELKGNQNISGATITMTDRQTELTGVLTNDRGEPAVDYTLVVFAADQRYWTPNSRRIRSTRPATDGRFTFANLPAGEYRIAPILDLEPGATSDPAFLQQLEATSLRVTLQRGEKKVQDIRVQ